MFLTKVTVDGDLQKGWVYDATNHLDIPSWIANGKLTTNDPANDAFKAYKNNSSLLQGEALKNVVITAAGCGPGRLPAAAT